MITPDYCQMMALYNQWMNQKIYGLCEQLTEQELKSDRGAFFGSIQNTLNHLIYGDRAWLSRFTQVPCSIPNLGQDLYPDFASLQSARNQLDQELIDWTATVTERWLAQPFSYTSNVDQKTRTLPTGVLVTHLFNHQTHHRGQVTTLLSQLGHDPGVTDLPWMGEL